MSGSLLVICYRVPKESITKKPALVGEQARMFVWNSFV